MKNVLSFLIIVLLVQSNLSQIVYNNPITFKQYLRSAFEVSQIQLSEKNPEKIKDSFKGEKIVQFSFGVLSATTIVTGLVMLIVGEINEDKYFELALQVEEEYKNATNIDDFKKYKEKYDLYYDKLVQSQKISKSGVFMQLGGGIGLGVSFLWRFGINKRKKWADHKSDKTLSLITAKNR